MDQNQVINFLRKMGSSPQAFSKMEHLLRLSVQAMDILKGLQAAKPEERDQIRLKFIDTQKEISKEYERVMAEMGFTKEMLQEYVSNPKNFTPENWAFIQSLQQQNQMAPAPQTVRSEKKKARKSKLATSKTWLSA